MTVTAADLTAAFPEFADTTLFPTSQVNFWLGIANQTLTADLFGTQLTVAICLYVAHNIVLSAQAARAAAAGGGVGIGAVSGPVTSKSVGPISKGIDVSLSAYAGAGPWNATSYGQRYYQLLKAVASGPFYATKQVTVSLPTYGFGSI